MFATRLFDEDFFAPFFRVHRRLRPARVPVRRAYPRGDFGFPELAVATDADSVEVEALVPGLGEEDVELEVHGRTLTLRGARPESTAGEGETLMHQERATGAFHRTVQLPFAVDPGQVEATLRHGVLRIRMRRPEADRPRKIAIQAG